jgi:plastocyanin
LSKKSKRRKGGQVQRTAEQEAPESQAELEAREARRAQQKAEWAAQKKKQDSRAAGAAVPVWAWIGGVAVGGLVAVAGAFLLLSGGGDSDDSPQPTATVDPRVEGLPIDQTVEIEAGGAESASFFNPTTITGNAGEVIEIVVNNTGTVSHNLRVSGEDKEYGDDRVAGDDWVSDTPIQAGDTGRALVKIDQPGTYPFQCDFHPQVQKGNLVLN